MLAIKYTGLCMAKLLSNYYVEKPLSVAANFLIA